MTKEINPAIGAAILAVLVVVLGVIGYNFWTSGQNNGPRKTIYGTRAVPQGGAGVQKLHTQMMTRQQGSGGLHAPVPPPPDLDKKY